MLQVLVDLILRAGWNYVSVVNTEGDKKIILIFQIGKQNIVFFLNPYLPHLIQHSSSQGYLLNQVEVKVHFVTNFEIQGDSTRLSQVIFFWRTKKCHNPMIFRELLLGGFGILMFQKCQVSGNLTFKACPINSICCTIQGLNTQIHPQMHQTLHVSINSTQIPFEKLLKHPPQISRQHETLTDTIRHQKTTATTIWCQPERPHILKQPFWVSGMSLGVC